MRIQLLQPHFRTPNRHESDHIRTVSLGISSASADDKPRVIQILGRILFLSIRLFFYLSSGVNCVAANTTALPKSQSSSQPACIT